MNESMRRGSYYVCDHNPQVGRLDIQPGKSAHFPFARTQELARLTKWCLAVLIKKVKAATRLLLIRLVLRE